MKIIQKKQIKFAWQYLVLGVDVMRAELRWEWSNRMNQEHLMPIFEAWSPEVVVWDGASAHRGQAMAALGFEPIQLPPYSPELNPAERIFEEIRREIEGVVYPSLYAKRLVIEQYLRRLRADKPRLRQLIQWHWIREVYQKLDAD